MALGETTRIRGAFSITDLLLSISRSKSNCQNCVTSKLVGRRRVTVRLTWNTRNVDLSFGHDDFFHKSRPFSIALQLGILLAESIEGSFVILFFHGQGLPFLDRQGRQWRWQRRR